MSKQRCGNCLHWVPSGSTGEWGWCGKHVPPIPFPVPIFLCTDSSASWRDTAASDGENCPTWESMP